MMYMMTVLSLLCVLLHTCIYTKYLFCEKIISILQYSFATVRPVSIAYSILVGEVGVLRPTACPTLFLPDPIP